jgi:hypothetical protein
MTTASSGNLFWMFSIKNHCTPPPVINNFPFLIGNAAAICMATCLIGI